MGPMAGVVEGGQELLLLLLPLGWMVGWLGGLMIGWLGGWRAGGLDGWMTL